MLGRLDSAFRAERALVDDVSHELRNPVAVIQTNVEAVLANAESTPAERREATAVVTRATGRMSRLLDDLLATARKRSSAFVDRDVDLAGLARNISAEYARLAAERSLQLDLRLASGRSSTPIRPRSTGPCRTCCPTRSAWHRRAARSPSPPAAAGLGLGGSPRRGSRDRRRGSGPDLRPLPPRLRPLSQGSGLGLTIARQIVESHQGRLVLAQRSGPGSTFVIWLPERAVAGAPERSLEPPDGDPLGRSAAETLAH